MVRTIEVDDIAPPDLMTARRTRRCGLRIGLRSLLAAGAGEREFVLDVGGNGAGVELRRVVETEPLEHLRMVFVVGIGEDLFEVAVSPCAAAVFWWARPF